MTNNDEPTETTSDDTGTMEASKPDVIQVAIRTTPEDKDRWAAAAEKLGMSVNEMVVTNVQKLVSETLDCAHRNIKYYAWRTICLDCKVTLSK